MSSILIDIPTYEVNENELLNIVKYVYKHEEILKEFGAIKIKPNAECKLGLIKRRKCIVWSPIEEIVKKSKDEGIYLVEKVDHIDESIAENLLKMNEFSFWSSLSCSDKKERQLNISLLLNKSFFSCKRPRSYFDIHRLPNQSILKLGGNKLIRQIVPCMKRSYGSGSIFPLNCVEHHLFSIDYHHEGGDHHWYIIPNNQRDYLKRLIKKNNSSICLDHGKLLIDPFILNKNHIRYHKVVQRPNEFIILSAGTLSQSFSEDANLRESISFGLPSWIEHGHAKISHSSCQCNIHQHSTEKTIDLTLFRHELIQRYIISQLNINIDQKLLTSKDYNDNIDIITIPTPCSTETITPNSETPTSTHVPFFSSHQSTVSSFQSPSTSSITQSVSSYLFEDDDNISNDNNIPLQYQLIEEDTVCNAFDWKTSAITLIDSIANDHLSESNKQTSQHYQTTPALTHIYRNVTDNCTVDNCFLSFEELMDILPSTTVNAEPTYRQDDENIDTIGSSTVPSNIDTTIVNKQSHVTDNEELNQTINNHKILFVTGLRRDVTKHDIRSHFTGCRKVTIKQSRTTPHLKYAFVLHHTSREAERNLRRPIDFHLLGHQCRVEYAGDSLDFSNNHKCFGSRKLIVARIPENVTETDLRHLFVDCRILKYCPARMIHSSATTTKMDGKSKIIWGYAFVLCDDEQQAANMIKHVDRYQIKGQPLAISVYRNKKSSYATTSNPSVD